MRNSLLGDVCGHDALSAAGGRWPERLLRMSFGVSGCMGFGVSGFGDLDLGFRGLEFGV